MIGRPVARSQGGGLKPGGSRMEPVQAADSPVPTTSPLAGGAVSTTGPASVIATVCSKWALGRPSTVD